MIPILSITLFLPLAAGLLLLIIPRENVKTVQRVGVIFALAAFALSVAVWVLVAQANGGGGQLPAEVYEWIPAFSVRYHLEAMTRQDTEEYIRPGDCPGPFLLRAHRDGAGQGVLFPVPVARDLRVWRLFGPRPGVVLRVLGGGAAAGGAAHQRVGWARTGARCGQVFPL